MPHVACFLGPHERRGPRHSARHLNWSFWEGIFRGSGGLFHALNHPVSPTKRPNAKRKSKTKAFSGLPELISSPPSTCPTTTLVEPTRPLSPLARLTPTRRLWVHQRSALPLHTPDIRLEPHMTPPYPATSPLFSSLYPPPFCTTGQRGTGRHNAKDGHEYRHTHPTRVTHEHRAIILGGKKRFSDIGLVCAACACYEA
jgi:hypothetical protein